MAALASLRPTTGLFAAQKPRPLAPLTLGRRPTQQQLQRQLQRQPLQVAASYSGGGGGGGRRRRSGPRGGGRTARPSSDTVELVKEYALPALGLLVAGSLIGPLIGGVFAFGATIAALGAATIVFLPAFALFGLPVLMMGGLAVGVLGGALLLPSLIQLALIGGGLWLGATAAQQIFGVGGSGGGPTVSPDGTIDVEAETIDDDWRKDMFKEQKEREQELKDFDQELRRREERRNRY